MSPERTMGAGVLGLGTRGLQCLGRHMATARDGLEATRMVERALRSMDERA